MTRIIDASVRRRVVVLAAVVLLAGGTFAFGAARIGATAQPSGYVHAMQRVSASTGWALTSQRLARTTDGGTSWTDITPVGVTTRQLIGVRFVDETHGWAVVPGVQSNIPPGQTPLLVYRTADGGSTWIPAPLGTTTYGGAGSASVFFVDLMHGWVVVPLESSSQFNPGDLFATSDGGLTWTKRRVPVGGRISFVTPTTGWVAGGGPGNQIFMSADGGASWTQQSVVLPAGQSQPVYGVPSQVGRMLVLFTTFASDANPAAGAYISQDGGATWQLISSVTAARPVPVAVTVRVAVVDTNTWFAVFPDAQRVYRTTTGGSSFAALTPAGLPVGVQDIGFVTSAQGWALSQYGSCTSPNVGCADFGILSATNDGGATWSRLGP